MNKTNELLIAALETFPNFIVVDQEGTVVYINESYAKINGMTQEQAIGLPIQKVIPTTRMLYVMQSGKAEMGSIMTLHNHVTQKPISLVCNRIPLWKDGKVIGAVGGTNMEDLAEIDRRYNEVTAMRKETEQIKRELEKLKTGSSLLNQMVGVSFATELLKNTVREYAKTDLSMLINGEKGVGKDHFARTVHQESNRSIERYIKLSCAAIPENMLEAELFGYAPGAFPRAGDSSGKGKILMADRGTLLLDEVGALPLNLQDKLLKVIQTKELLPMGATKTIPVDVRFICSTSENLRKQVEDHLFRADLYCRINSVELTVPPLRERPADIVPLTEFFIDRINRDYGYAISGVSYEVQRMLETYLWPGNIRELQHTIGRAAERCRAGQISVEHMDFVYSTATPTETGSDVVPLKTSKDQTERLAIIQALQSCGGNKSKAARMLKIDRSVLYNKINKYDIEIDKE